MAIVAAAAVSAAVAIGTTVYASESQKSAISSASNKQKKIEQQQLDFQKQIYDEGAPSREAFNRMLASLESESKIGVGGDSQLRSEMDLLNTDLAATGNLRSGAGQELTQQAIERAYDRRFARQSTVASIASGHGESSTTNAIGLSGPIAQTGTNISNLTLGAGASQAGLYSSLGSSVSGLAQAYALSQYLKPAAAAA